VRSRYWVSGYPDLVAEWDRERNGDLRPDGVSAGSARRIWWKCSRGVDHVWRAKPNNRTAGSGCPFCSNKRASVTNSLANCFPEIAAEWLAARNGNATTTAVVATSSRVAWWQCAANPEHQWRATVRDRTRRLTGCPFCSSRRVSDEASLARCNPWLAGEWDHERNGALLPDGVLPGSNRIVWWRCAGDRSHRWRASVSNRFRLASGCPYCAGRRKPSPRPSREREE
jgi:hypothetical protein